MYRILVALAVLTAWSLPDALAQPARVGLGMTMDDASYEEVPLAPALMRGSTDAIPDRYSLRPYAPYAADQGLTATCVGWATAYAARTIVAAIENGWTDRAYITDQAYSPSFIYNQLKKRYASSGPDPTCSKGAHLVHGMELLKQSGAAPLSAFPFDCDIEVRDEDLELAEDHRIIEYQRVFTVGAVDKIKNVRRALSEGKPVVIGMNVPTSFLMAWGKEVWEPSNEGEQAEGGHAMTVVGYDDDKYGGAFEVMNSWGERWGDDGFIWIPYDHFARYVRYGFSVFVSRRPEPDQPDLAGEVALLLASGDTMRVVADGASYRVDRPYESGTQFKIELTNQEPAYLYAVATDLTRKVTRIIPHDDSYSAFLTLPGSRLAFPPVKFITMDDQPGTDYLGLIYARRELDIASLIDRMATLPGSLHERIEAALGDALIAPGDVSVQADGRLAFEAKSASGHAVSLVVAIDHAAPVASQDRVPPSIELLSPKPLTAGTRGLEVRKKASDHLEVVGTAHDFGGLAEVHVNGQPAEILADGVSYRAEVPGADTVSVIHVRAIDTAGNEAATSFRVAVRKADTQPPTITLRSPELQREPPAEAHLSVDTLRVVGSARDGGEVTAVYVNGFRAELQPGGGFVLDVPIFDGNPMLLVRALDDAGNMAEETWYVSDATLFGQARQAETEEPFVQMEVFYATDRAPTGRAAPAAFYGGEPGPLSYGIAEVSIPRTHRVGELEAPAWWRLDLTAVPSRHIVLQHLEPMEGEAFFDEMRDDLARSEGRSVFVYVHGYNTRFEHAARRTAQLAYDLSFDGVAAMYSWPSDGTLLGYANDEVDVEGAVRHLQDYLERIVADSGAEEVHLIAHSMGNRALTGALMALADSYEEPLFAEVLLTAPDIDKEVFVNEIAPAIKSTAQRMTLYTSANDKALEASERVHGKPRAGDSGDGVVVIDGVETVDVSAVDTALLGLGHSYFAETQAVLEDLVSVIGMRLEPDQRRLLERAQAAARYWLLPFN